jgi:transposase
VLDAADGGVSARAAARRFGIGESTAIRWVSVWRERGEREARRQGHPPGLALDAEADFLMARIEEQCDLTLEELRRLLRTERGVSVGRTAIWTFLARRELTLKKSPATRRSRIGPT